MLKNLKIFLLLFTSLFMIGCKNNDVESVQEQAPHIDLLRSHETTQEDNHPVYYMIDLESERIGVLNQVGEDFSFFALDEFSQADDKIEFIYDSELVSLQKESRNVYTDENGTRYQLIQNE